MNIYFSGIGGVGIGPLAQIAQDAGHTVIGSDREDSLMIAALRRRGITVTINQDGSFLQQSHQATPIDWLIYTSALPDDHPELVLARQLGIKTAKRDELLAHIIKEKGLKLIAVAGTHGKTTTTGMIVWLAKYFGLPVSYSVGTTLTWGPSGHYAPDSEYFVYECDEFDRNFLHFNPYISLVTSVEYDHPDTYPTADDYYAAFRQFADQSTLLVTWRELQHVFNELNSVTYLDETSARLTLHGEHNRRNASLILAAIEKLGLPAKYAADGLNKFPGTNRRFEKLANNLYTDYGHTPTEIAATLQMARELSDNVVLVYQPHQNIRQHEIRNQYTDEIFKDAETVYWLPTYLSRENPKLPILTPGELSESLANIQIADLDDNLWQYIQAARDAGKLVLCMGAGTIDGWIRDKL
ncbi:MAG TPA: Mur ligase domain-containing protein [Candidatus Saccharibacteria bacterium]|nr:Mur ligase domain-containing protein [Candidatus Saccharibacteria bacterium]